MHALCRLGMSAQKLLRAPNRPRIGAPEEETKEKKKGTGVLELKKCLDAALRIPRGHDAARCVGLPCPDSYQQRLLGHAPLLVVGVRVCVDRTSVEAQSQHGLRDSTYDFHSTENEEVFFVCLPIKTTVFPARAINCAGSRKCCGRKTI